MNRFDACALPRDILLATDLGHRCDRALDRTITCARDWRAAVLVLAVLEHDAVPNEAARGERERQLGESLRDELQADDVDLRARLGHGDPAEVAVEIAALERSDLIVTGIARSSPLSDILLGRTVDRVVRNAPVPVLVVRRRGRVGYRRVVVGTDLSEASRKALLTALAWFPRVPVLLFHAYRPPMSGLVSDSEQARSQMYVAALAECQAFLDACGLSGAERERVAIHAEYGQPEQLLADYERKVGADLVVLGSHGRGAVFDVLIGSTARRVLEQVDTDVLVVRVPKEPG